MKLTRILFLTLFALLTWSILFGCGELSETDRMSTTVNDDPATTTQMPVAVLTDYVDGWNEDVNYEVSANHAKDPAKRAREQGWVLLNEFLTCVEPTHSAMLDGDPDTSVGHSVLYEEDDMGEIQAEFTVEPNVELQIYAVAIRYADDRILGENALYGVNIGELSAVLEHLYRKDELVENEDGALQMPSEVVYIELNENAAPQSVTSTRRLNALISVMPDGAVVDIAFYGEYITY